MKKITPKIDHIIYTVPDLEIGIDIIENLFDERPYFGGQHLGKGSHNALLSLGEDVYLEIIAPDPNQPEPALPRSFALDKRTKPQLATWAASTINMEQTVLQAREAGYDPGDLVDGGRKREDGVQLKWRSTKRPESIQGTTPPGDWLIPFLIDWGNTPHPAQARPSRCRLISLAATHPEPQAVQVMLHALGLEMDITESERIGLIAVIESPNGRVELS